MSGKHADRQAEVSRQTLNYTWYCWCGAMCRDPEAFCPACSRARETALWDARKHPRTKANP